MAPCLCDLPSLLENWDADKNLGDFGSQLTSSLVSGTSQRKMATSYGEILAFLSPEHILSHNGLQCYPHFKHLHHPEELFSLWRIGLKSV